MVGVKQVLLTDMCCDFSLLYWLSSARFSSSKTSPAKSSGAPLSARECWVTSAWVWQFNSSSQAGYSAQLCERADFTRTAQHTPQATATHPAGDWRTESSPQRYMKYTSNFLPPPLPRQSSFNENLLWQPMLETNFVRCTPMRVTAAEVGDQTRRQMQQVDYK